MAVSFGSYVSVPPVTYAPLRHWIPLRCRIFLSSGPARGHAAVLVLGRTLLAALLAAPLVAQTPGGSDVPNGSLVEQILVTGLNRVQEAVVLRQMKSQVGGMYSDSNVDKDREQLDRMGVFSRIIIETHPGANGVILQVDLKETSPYLVFPAIGVTAEQGITAGVGLKSTNFLRSGANLSSAVRFGGATEFEIIVASPWKPRKSWWWKSEYFLRDRFNPLDDFQEFSNELNVDIGRQVNDRLRVSGSFRFLSVKSDVSGITLSPTNRDVIPGLGVVAEYDSRDSRTNAKRGWWNSVDATKNGIAGDGNYWTFNFDVRRYQLLSGRHDLAMFSLLTLQTGTVGTDIPIHEDFHIGGTNTLRGWDIDARHGKDQWLNTLEYRYELFKVHDYSIKGFNFYSGIQLAVFADAGSAWNVKEELTNNFIGGAGFGIRWIIPYVDFVRLDFGFGQSNKGVIAHFGILEKAVYERRRVR
jgi:outer membrane protein insertion porin family